MKLKYSFETVDMGEEIIMVPVGNNARNSTGVLKLNREGKEIVDCLNTNMTEEMIIEKISSKYENDPSEIREYVHKAIAKLNEAGLLLE